ncbi:MAG TPA: HisS family protein [Ktedonobacteraceae bacterium]|nr:HisS family protein [Ktedonobacteraceae bacterium]
MKKRVERLRGMYDLLPEMYLHQRWVIDQLSTFLTQAGYAQVNTPVLERSDLFEASFGQELWQKLYAFRLHNRELCLRPEYTASICRLYLDHYQQQPLPLRFQYAGSIFRYEAPGRARYRQHTQLGVELFGGNPFATDAEILQLACNILHEMRISHYRLELGHIGVVTGFINRLQLDSHAAHLLLGLMEQISRSEKGERIAQERLEALYPPDPSLEKLTEAADQGVQARYVTSLLDGISVSFGDDDIRREIVERFLWKMGRSEQRRQILHALEFLRALHAVSGPPPEVFSKVRELLDRYGLDPVPLTELQQLVSIVEQCGVPPEQIVLNLSLGRGVSYYTGLVFEIHAQEEDGFDTQLCGGGRYDHLMSAIGSPRELNACGFAFGVDRLLSLIPCEILPSVATTQALVIPVHAQDVPYALQVAHTARSLGVRTEVDVSDHGVSAGLRLAARRQIRLALIVGEEERHQGLVTVRDLVTGEEQVSNVEALAQHTWDKEQCL